MKRRVFMASAAALAATLISIKPSREGGPHSAYFATLNTELKSRRLFQPTLNIDLDAVDDNISNMLSLMNPTAAHRIPVKSLPCVDLVRYCMQKIGTNRLMVFHIPFVQILTEAFPDSDLLFGKPMPVGAAHTFYERFNDQSSFDPSQQLQWLIDSKLRLQQYLELAKKFDTTLKVNIEIDVGLHRGGLATSTELPALLDLITNNPQHLQFSGFMGYDPHVVKLPSLVKSQTEAYAESQQTYQSFIDTALNHRLEFDLQNLCLNGAGSPSLALHKNNTVCNDLTAGSCLVKPTDFDIPSLESMRPAAFISTPILKRANGVVVPGIGDVSNIISTWNPNREQTFYIYGGRWMASYVSPPGLIENHTLMNSTNQQLVNASNEVDLQPDDFVFLRPSQSEFVFLQFGDLRTIRDGRITSDQWPVFAQSGAHSVDTDFNS